MAAAQCSPDVAVLCAIPLDAGRWDEVAAAAPLGDFVRFVAEGRLQTSVADAWAVFSNEAGVISRKLDEIERRGVHVVRSATAAHIAQAAKRHRHVVVIAHWKELPLPSDDRLPCHRLEMHDAMLTAADFTQLFPVDFAGTVYLIVCTSDIPAETFRRSHPDVICICSDEPMLIGLSVVKLDVALKLMQAQKLPLWKALLGAADLIDRMGR